MPLLTSPSLINQIESTESPDIERIEQEYERIKVVMARTKRCKQRIEVTNQLYPQETLREIVKENEEETAKKRFNKIRSIHDPEG
jgi:hypothetical protein